MEDIKEVLLETTADLPKHTYYINTADKIAGFKREGTDSIKWFTKPLSFSKRYRKFKKVVDKDN